MYGRYIIYMSAVNSKMPPTGRIIIGIGFALLSAEVQKRHK